jgi:hypothetical protein
MGELWFEASLGKKISKTLYPKMSQACCFMPLILATWEAEVEGSCLETGLGKSTIPYLKKNLSKKVRDAAQVKW